MYSFPAPRDLVPLAFCPKEEVLHTQSGQTEKQPSQELLGSLKDGKAYLGYTSQRESLTEGGVHGLPRSLPGSRSLLPSCPDPSNRPALTGADVCSTTRAVPTFITSSVLSPPPSLPELLGLAVPLASLGGS